MRVYYEDSYCYGHHHHHHRPNIEVDVYSGWGGAYYPPQVARPEVVVVNQATTYMPPSVMPQPYAAAGQPRPGYQYQQLQPYQQYNNPPYPRW